MTIELRLEVGDEQAREYKFDRTTVVVGCHPFNDLVVAERGLSARHGELRIEQATLHYEDLGSSGGSKLRHGDDVRRLDADAHPVSEGDVLLLGADEQVQVTILGFGEARRRDSTTQTRALPDPGDDGLDGLPPELPEALMAGTRRVLRERTLQSAIELLQTLVDATLPGGDSTLVVPQGEDTFHDRALMCRDGAGCATWVSPDSARLIEQLVCRNVLQVQQRHGETTVRVPFAEPGSVTEPTDSSPSARPVHRGKPLGYLRVTTNESPTDAQLDVIARACAWLAPVLLTVLDLDRLRTDVAKLEAENQYFRKRRRRHYLFKELVSESEPMRRLYNQIHRLLNDDGGVLIVGEAGCGKKMVGRALHHLGARRDGMFIAQHCGELPPDELDRELFGRSATDGIPAQKGLFELADGGTLFLDEIDRLSMRAQTRLVRTMREHEVRREGEESGRDVDVRILAATHRNLLALARRGRFRRDLLGAFGGSILRVPPLRERHDDLGPLIDHFIDKYNSRYGHEVTGISDAACERLHAHAWPGNVRELQVVIETAVIKAKQGELQPRHFDLAAQSDHATAHGATGERQSKDAPTTADGGTSDSGTREHARTRPTEATTTATSGADEQDETGEAGSAEPAAGAAEASNSEASSTSDSGSEADAR